jgi:predicted TIM-barrel fold metal-dependent hydrolase
MAARLPSKGVLHRVVTEMGALSLKDAVKEMWLHGNATRLFQRA